MLHSWRREFGGAAVAQREARGGETLEDEVIRLRREVQSLKTDRDVLKNQSSSSSRSCDESLRDHRDGEGAPFSAVSESFFATLKKELVHGLLFVTRTEAYDSISEYIDNYYNARRRHSANDYQSPNTKEFQAAMLAA